VKICRNCWYFESLTEQPESYGTCKWPKLNDWPDLPIWCHPAETWGSLPPTQAHCKTWRAKHEEAA